MSKYRGKTVWITGASSGIGEALAHRFAEQGAQLLLSGRRVERLEQVARASGASVAEVLPLDLEDLASLPAKVERALALTGGVDIMVHNAGIGQRAAVRDTSIHVERRLLEVNYLGPVALSKALLPSMLARKSGQFVVISSVLGLMSVKNRAGYCASKHALHGWFNALRAELAGDGIAVLLVCPGHVNTEFSLHALKADGRAHGVVDAGQKSGLSPQHCAQKIVSALERGKDEIYVAKWESLGVYLNRFAPGLLRAGLARTRR